MYRICLILAGLVFLGQSLLVADDLAKTKETLSVTLGQKEFLAQEPILVKVHWRHAGFAGLPAALGVYETKLEISVPLSGRLRFDVKPAVKPRAKAKPLPLEEKASARHLRPKHRTYDLLEWFQFPASGQYTVQAVVESHSKTWTSEPATITIRRPDKKDAEWGPVDRLHHIPWCNYVTDAFCGDTFDLVKRWPDSKLARHSHYWSGLHQQHKKEYDKAIASFRTVVEKYPDFVLADHAQFGIVECLAALNKPDEARKRNAVLLSRMPKTTNLRGDMSTVHALSLHYSLNAVKAEAGKAEAPK